jgi:hypothetical protein
VREGACRNLRIDELPRSQLGAVARIAQSRTSRGMPVLVAKGSSVGQPLVCGEDLLYVLKAGPAGGRPRPAAHMIGCDSDEVTLVT